MKAVHNRFITIVSVTMFLLASYSLSFAETKVTASGTVANAVTIEGTIPPGQDLYLTIAQHDAFKPSDATMPHEKKNFAKETKKQGFGMDTSIPPSLLYFDH